MRGGRKEEKEQLLANTAELSVHMFHFRENGVDLKGYAVYKTLTTANESVLTSV